MIRVALIQTKLSALSDGVATVVSSMEHGTCSLSPVHVPQSSMGFPGICCILWTEAESRTRHISSYRPRKGERTLSTPQSSRTYECI